MDIKALIEDKLKGSLKDCSKEELYVALVELVKDLCEGKRQEDAKKKVYYVSAEFLIGKLLTNNLINLGIWQEVRELLEANGKDLAELSELEVEPSLGNGGLGRLAACFLDSIATLGLSGTGIGLNYHLGLFRQVFEDRKQKEQANPWIETPTWLRKTKVRYPVSFGKCKVWSNMYELDVVGYQNRINKLCLFDIESVDDTIVGENNQFDKSDIEKNLTLFLYPDDSDEEGKKLRLYQQYFMVSNAARMILDECKAKNCNLYDLDEYAVIQINDTHPTMIIPELIRLLTLEGMDMDRAIDVVSKTCAYTNHTILSEALEKWPRTYLQEVVPQLVPIIEVLDERVRRNCQDERVVIIDQNDIVHMAHIDIHYSFSVNGVAHLHTEILKNTELNHFYQLYPEKFTNKTNGITFRRWLLSCNQELAKQITEWIGDDYKKDATKLKDLMRFVEDEEQLQKLLAIKQEKKRQLVAYLKKTQGISIQEHSIFDIQIKRLHEYKRQQLNVLYVIHKYLEIKNGTYPTTPITVIFGAKAAPAYVIAKDIIHLILCLQELINKDAEVNNYLNVVMVENYNVTLAEKLIPACDISEQISLASKEASGTGNMKFMLNGAVTLGTEDGANVEIHQAVGDENIYIFGAGSDEVIRHYEKADYKAGEYYEQNADIREAVDFIIGEELMALGDKEMLTRLHQELVTKDWFMTFLDYDDYVATKERAFADYENRMEWAKKMLVNISQAGYFSSDRTIEEYNRDIWLLTE